MVDSGLAAFFGEVGLAENLFGLGGGEAFVEVVDRDAGELAEPGAELAGLAGFLALVAIERTT